VPLLALGEEEMVYWALMFLVLAIVLGAFGFPGLAVAASGIAKLLVFVFLLLFAMAFATHLSRS
jgi:uncharacterized membrane protein YtjA (UPF0391 family)